MQVPVKVPLALEPVQLPPLRGEHVVPLQDCREPGHGAVKLDPDKVSGLHHPQ